eukprot:1468820-Karenia_brevis.AAC.1
MGWRAPRMGTLVDPAMHKHVSNQVRDDAAVAKEVRKAREENKLRKGRGRGRGGKGSPEGGAG